MLAAYHDAVEHGEERCGVVSVPVFESGDEAVGEVLGAYFIAVLHQYAERLAVGCRNAAQHLSHISVEVCLGMLAAHFVDFVSGGVGACRFVYHTCGGHAHAQYCPFACGHIPIECAV